MRVLHFAPEGLDDNSDMSHELVMEGDESVLETLLRSGIDVPFGCKGGVCQTCLLVSKGENIPAAAQVGLNQAQKDQGFFLSCCCKPDGDMRIAAGEVHEKKSALVLDKTPLSEEIFRLRIEKVFDYKPGQFCTLWRDKHIARSYSLASCSVKDEFLEFHIKHIPDGAFSHWAYSDLQVGDKLTVQGPMGQCYYTETDSTKPLFLAGIGTGLAPLYGIARNALRLEHAPEIHLVIGGRSQNSIYFSEQLKTLSDKYENFHFQFVVQKKSQGVDFDQSSTCKGDVYSWVKDSFPEFQKRKVFLCGADTFVKKMKRQCFMSGASMKDIASDPFLSFSN